MPISEKTFKIRCLRDFLIASILGVITGAIYAGDPLPSFYQDTGINPFRATVNQGLEEHIDPFTGMLQLHHTDAVLPGNGHFDLVIHRAFNSPSSSFGSLSDVASYNHTPNVGIGWSLMIGGRLHNYGPGTGSACQGGSGNQMVFETPDGSRQALIRTSIGAADFVSSARWKAVCVTGGVQVFAPNGTRYDMTRPIVEFIPNTIQNASFYYPDRIVDRNGNTATFNYITVGGTITLLDSISTSDGRSISFQYALNGAVYLLTAVYTSLGSWRFDYQVAFSDPFSHRGVAYLLTAAYPPNGGSWSYFYNACPSPTGSAGACSISRFTYPDGGSNNYQYQFVNFNDLIGLTSVVSYKSNGLGSWTFNYSPGSPLDTTSVQTPLGAITYRHFGYTNVAPGNVWKVGLLAQRDTGGIQSESFTWTPQQISSIPVIRGNGVRDPVTNAPLMTNRTITRDGNSYSTSYSGFDQYGNPTSIGESGDRSRTISKNYCTNAGRWITNVPGTESISGLGSITRGFDGNCNLTSETRYGVTTTFGYSGAGDMTSKRDANGNTTFYGGYFRGIPAVENRPMGVTINRTVDLTGNLLSQTDGAGNNYQYSYDGIRRLTSVTPPTGASTSIGWTGHSSRNVTRGGYSESMGTDGYDNPVRVTRNGIAKTFDYDAFSNMTFESLPASASGTSSPRDILGRVTALVNSDGTRRSISYSGGTVRITDERGNATTYRYAAYGDPDTKFLIGINLPTGNNLTINRDTIGNITSVSQGGITRMYGYNGSFFLTSITDPETGTTTFGRDAVGNMTSSTVGGKQTTYGYDGLNRLTGASFPDGQSVAVTYFGNGRAKTVTRTGASWTYAYDGNANLTSETLAVGSQSFVVNYTYNANDALASIKYPITNEVVSYSPDGLGRSTSASPYVTSVNYFSSGNISQMTYGNGVSMNFNENTRQWPSSLSASKSGTFLNRSYGYDGVGNVTQITDFASPSQSMTLTYDTINQLTSAIGPWGSASMGYDAVGNISTYNVGASTRIYSYSNNRLATFTTPSSSRSFAYDGYGNVTNDGLHQFQFDDSSNLVCVDCLAVSKIAYAYDGNNRRVSRTQNGVTTYYVHGSEGRLLLEYTPTGTTIEHVYLQGKRIATKTLP